MGRTTLTVAAISLSLTLSAASFADSPKSERAENGYSSEAELERGIFSDLGPLNGRIVKPNSFSEASETASYFFKIGVKNYEKGNLDKAEKSFEAVLRTKDLVQQSNYYLARINAKQGEDENVLKYVKAYHGIQ